MACDVEKVIIPSSVKTLGNRAFFVCKSLSEVEFEHDSQLEYIG